MRLPIRSKALAYIVRWRGESAQVLVFEHDGHPEAGVQVPLGTVDPGETGEQACIREILEETGVAVAGAAREAGEFPYVHVAKREFHRRHVFVIAAPPGLPEAWAHTVTGDGNDRGRRYACRWLDAGIAERTLATGQGTYLRRALGRRRPQDTPRG